jgi:hypothetical protein
LRRVLARGVCKRIGADPKNILRHGTGNRRWWRQPWHGRASAAACCKNRCPKQGDNITVDPPRVVEWAARRAGRAAKAHVIAIRRAVPQSAAGSLGRFCPKFSYSERGCHLWVYADVRALSTFGRVYFS